MGKRRLRPLARELGRIHPELPDPVALIRAGRVLVDGRVVDNPASLVPAGSSIAVRGDERLRGEAKLEFALGAFRVPVAGRVALDAGAAAGGFTRVLLRAGASRVYAVDAGHGQLLGSLRADSRVVSLERVNLAGLTVELVPDVVDVVTLDLSYLAVAAAAPQLERLRVAPDADLVALVKPMFELRLSSAPRDPARAEEAARLAAARLESTGWRVAGRCVSPVRGSRGAVEAFVHATRHTVGTRP